MKITVIFTGGTIGSTVMEDGYIAPNADSPYRLLSAYQKEQDCSDMIFETREPYRILSENLEATYINQLIEVVWEALADKENDGIIITHGTDTLQYSASILSYVFGTDIIPILLVSSDFPLEDKRANGLINFAGAVEFIKHQYGRGVFASYQNQMGLLTIHYGNRMLSHIAYSADMLSVENEIHGFFIHSDIQNYHPMCEENLYIGKDVLIQGKAVKSYPSIQTLCENQIPVLRDCGKEILCISPYPNMEYPTIPEETKIILHGSYHSGTIAVNEKLFKFAAQAKEKKIPFFITGVPYQEKEYATVKEYEELGICVLYRMSPLAAYCKAWLCISCGLDVEEVMQIRIAEDIII